MPDGLRLFVAITLSDDQKAAIAKACAILHNSGTSVRWVAKENYHLTLKFLGSVEAERLEAVCQVISDSVSIPAFPLQFKGFGGFPNTDVPRVVWVGVEGDTRQLQILAAGLESGLEPLGFQPESKFSPHLTVGRIKFPKRDDDLKRALAAGTDIITQCRVTSISLMKSDLSPEGPRYSELEHYHLFVP